MTSFLVTGAVGILTGLPGEAARAAGDIRVEAGTITELGDLAARPGERIVDASGCVVTPGLVNTHHHLFQSVLKAVPAGMNEPLAPWLRLVPYSYWHLIDDEALRVAARIGLAELMLSGATTVADHHYFYSDRFDYDPSAVLFEEAERLGIRFALLRGGATKARRFDGTDMVPLPTESFSAMTAAVERDVARFHDPAPGAMRRVVFAPTTPTYSLHPHELVEAARFARSLGIRLHSHLSEDTGYAAFTLAEYGARPVEWLAGHEWLGDDVWFAHLVDLSEREIALLAETGTGMAHCPQANARLGSGIAPAPELAARGGAVSLAVDGAAANEAADMASALFAAFSLHRAAKGAKAVRTEEIMRWATAGGAQVLGLPAIGTIAVGKQADLALFDMSNPRYLGQHDAVLGPVISGGQAQIRASFVAGKEIVVDGRIPGLDLGELGAAATRVVARIKQRAKKGGALAA
ncbi:amidohydrolase [Jiella endophytica]|uniref:Amidohydrolase n=1 Tax=Jiella endophytica TaxID=2558362 RepID=A0A4Y8RKD2_9HYPH|nr:amidohydrolase family protein [Jiella endophytica]TFF23217.1 amidohydrolase [Jiella endophytica]